MKDERINLNLNPHEDTERLAIIISDKISQPPKKISSKSLQNALIAGGNKIPNRDYQTALTLWTKGVRGDTFNATVLRSKGLLDPVQVKQMLRVGDYVKALEAVYPETTLDFVDATRPIEELKISKLEKGEPTHDVNVVILESKNDKLRVLDLENRGQFQSVEFQERSADYLTNFTNNALDRYEAEYMVQEQYQEPLIQAPSVKTVSTEAQTQGLPSTFSGVGNVVSNVTRGLTRTVSNAASTATRSVRSQAKRAVRQALNKAAIAAAPAIAQALLTVGAVILALGAILSAIVAIIGIFIAYFLGFAIIVVFMLFIINSGAYIVPPGTDLTGELSGSTVYTGPLPEECPSIWPVTYSTIITQGPLYCGLSGSHCRLQAIDVRTGVIGREIVATHTGTAVSGWDSCLGNNVRITSTCNGTEVTSVYAHLISVSVGGGQLVQRGRPVGISDNTGTCTTSAHLHYGFVNNALPMAYPYIPETVQPLSCCLPSACSPGGGPACTTQVN
ncbi:MAG TPA: M23 family metallopeptidase [Patescibacteria group bacterium]|nr:M23 family metallopeptidase [Patescibacteria group bacterium]